MPQPRRRRHLLLALIAAASLAAGCPSDPPADSEPPPPDDSETLPWEYCDGDDNDGDGQVDEGYDDTDGDGIADCVDGPWGFWEPFEDDSQLEEGGSATLDPLEGGWLTASASHPLSEAGDGHDGALEIVPGDHFDNLPALELTSLTIGSAGLLSYHQDLLIRVAGPVSVDHGVIRSEGDLHIVVDGPIDLHCGRILAEGDVLIEQLSDDGVRLHCDSAGDAAGVFSEPDTEAAGSSLRIWTRGGIEAVGSDGGTVQLAASDAPGSTAGSLVEVLSYGDQRWGAASSVRCLLDEPSGSGSLGFASEGSLRFEDGATVEIIDRDAIRRGSLALRAGGDLALSGAAQLRGGLEGEVSLLAEGSVTLAGGSAVASGGGETAVGALTVQAGQISLSGGSSLLGGDSGAGAGGSLSVTVAGAITLEDGSSLNAGGGTCGQGGSLEIAGAGDLSLRGASALRGGDSRGGEACEPQAGGSVRLVLAGSLDDNDGILSGGEGGSSGAVEVEEGASLQITVDAELSGIRTARSIALPVESPVNTIDQAGVGAVEGTAPCAAWIDPAGDGASLVPVEEAVGLVLQPGWRVEYQLGYRLFDGVRLDAFAVQYH
ncbi:MAG: hypothetical protein ABIO70_27330 [Pseudomonadota bacterium]